MFGTDYNFGQAEHLTINCGPMIGFIKGIRAQNFPPFQSRSNHPVHKVPWKHEKTKTNHHTTTLAYGRRFIG
jgi:hypothetical protein